MAESKEPFVQTPEISAAINQAVGAAVKEAVSGVFAQLGPVLQSLAITPEKLREANKPYIDPAIIAREKRERAESKARDEERMRLEAERKAACPHLDREGKMSISLVHNFHDRQPRGICVRCHDWITPREWRIAATEEEATKYDKNHVGRAYVAPAHKDYNKVMLIEANS